MSSSAPATPMSVPAGAHTATVAAGCFWGVEHMYRRQFGKDGLYDARVGYIGGETENPGYRAVCGGRTGRTLFIFSLSPFSSYIYIWDVGGCVICDD